MDGHEEKPAPVSATDIPGNIAREIEECDKQIRLLRERRRNLLKSLRAYRMAEPPVEAGS